MDERRTELAAFPSRASPFSLALEPIKLGKHGNFVMQKLYVSVYTSALKENKKMICHASFQRLNS